MDQSQLMESILSKIITKSSLKQKVYDSTFSTFNTLKETLFEMASEMDDSLEGKLDKRVRLEYRDRGKFECQMQIGTDILLFQMHTDVFDFPEDHPVMKMPQVNVSEGESFCGIIEIFNFLSDSFKFNRATDYGYLIGRIYINKDRNFFVEGKGQDAYRMETFKNQEINEESLKVIMQKAMLFALDFDSLIPPFSLNKIVTVEQFNTKMENSKFTNGKLQGYDFDIKDI